MIAIESVCVSLPSARKSSTKCWIKSGKSGEKSDSLLSRERTANKNELLERVGCVPFGVIFPGLMTKLSLKCRQRHQKRLNADTVQNGF